MFSDCHTNMHYSAATVKAAPLKNAIYILGIKSMFQMRWCCCLKNANTSSCRCPFTENDTYNVLCCLVTPLHRNKHVVGANHSRGTSKMTECVSYAALDKQKTKQLFNPNAFMAIIMEKHHYK